MKTVDIEIANKYSGDVRQHRRMIKGRRISQGRRGMIRFDKTGGDRRSGNARRGTDEGFRVQSDEG